jgi:colanic acid/amylovoran biosynthesis glycosyltransferase
LLVQLALHFGTGTDFTRPHVCCCLGGMGFGLSGGMSVDGRLVLLPPLPARRYVDGRVGMTRKFLAGVEEYLRHWRGPVRVVMEPSGQGGTQLDEVAITPAALPFELRLVPFGEDLTPHLRGASVVVAFTSHRQNRLTSLCKRLGVPSVYVTEYTLRTRWQIARAETPNPLRLARRCAWEAAQEHRQRQAIAGASGLQCNGTPTYTAYRALNPRPLLYFDTRTREDMLIPQHALHRRLMRMRSGRPLRLAFSGRLEAMKGAQYLPAVAAALRRQGIDFELSIAGGGRLESHVRREIRRQGLQRHVRLLGVLDFAQELLPWMQREVDLFVCPHVQGDPSCTYLETLACGVPVVGFANEALAGLATIEDVAWTARMADVNRVADLLGRLDHHRDAIEAASLRARRLAGEHTFEATFARRVDHLRQCIDASGHGHGPRPHVGPTVAGPGAAARIPLPRT